MIDDPRPTRKKKNRIKSRHWRQAALWMLLSPRATSLPIEECQSLEEPLPLEESLLIQVQCSLDESLRNRDLLPVLSPKPFAEPLQFGMDLNWRPFPIPVALLIREDLRRT